MSKKSNSNQTSNNKINNNNNENSFSSNSSFSNTKQGQNDSQKGNNFKDWSQIDKFNFIKNCLKKAEEREQAEETDINNLKLYEKTFISKINELKDDINETRRKIDEVKIAREDVEKQLKYKKVFLQENVGKNIDNKNEKKTLNEIQEINEGLELDINDIKKEMEKVKKDIEIMSEQSLEIYQDIDSFKKKCDELLKDNLIIEKRIKKKEKELDKIILDNKKLNDKINNQELSSENFLKKIEKWANKKSSINTKNIYEQDGQDHET